MSDGNSALQTRRDQAWQQAALWFSSLAGISSESLHHQRNSHPSVDSEEHIYMAVETASAFQH